jgi:hypothetical protein
MAAYRHHVSGFFPDRAPAEMTLKTLRQRGFNAAQLHIYSDNADVPPAPAPMAQSNAALKDMLVDGAIWTSQLLLDSLLFQKIRFLEFSR